MPRVATKFKHVSEEEVLRRWSSLDLEWRQKSLTFCDEALVSRLGATFTTLLESNRRMRHMGIRLAPSSAANNRLADPQLLIGCFHMSEGSQDSHDEPLRPAGCDGSVFWVDLKYLSVDDDLLQRLRTVLPDFLSARSGRRPTPAARWKELFARDPASVADYQQQLAKLVEQAFWVLPERSDVGAEKDAANSQFGELTVESWMLEADDCAQAGAKGTKGRRKKHRNQGFKSTPNFRCASSWASAGILEKLDMASTQAESTNALSDTVGTDNEMDGTDDDADWAQGADPIAEEPRSSSGVDSVMLRQTSSVSVADTCPTRQISLPSCVFIGAYAPIWSPLPNVRYELAAVVEQKNTFLDWVEGDKLLEMYSGAKTRASSAPPTV